MKRTFFILLFLLSANALSAQTFGEWFRQKSTQKKYLIEQIAALKVYTGFLKTGYNIGKKGLNTISNIKNGDFNLHRDFFGSLTVINPAIKHYSRVTDIVALQVNILKLSAEAKTAIGNSEYLKPEQRAYHHGVYNRLLSDCGNAIADLSDVAINSKLTLKDDERLNRIDILYTEMLDRYRFARAFTDDIKRVLQAKLRQNRDAALSKELFGIKK